MGKKGKLYLTADRQLINREGTVGLEIHCLANIKVMTDSGKNH